MEIIGSQVRDRLEDTEYEFVQWQNMSESACLLNTLTGNFEEWVQNDDFAGYVIVINSKGYEFVSEIV